MSSKIETAVLAGGCFWCTEAVSQRVEGVQNVTPVYTGGKRSNPTYEQICSGATGHAEAIKIEFNPDVISFTKLLYVFFSTHNPTTLNRQGNDIGTHYRSAVFYADETQKHQAEDVIEKLESEAVFDAPIVTSLEPLAQVYPAEKYHQNYYNQNKQQGYCQYVIHPKLEKLKQLNLD